MQNSMIVLWEKEEGKIIWGWSDHFTELGLEG